MAHAIERIMVDGNPVDCFAYLGAHPWHKLGQRLGESGDESVTFSDIEKAAKADWGVYKDALLAAKTGKQLKGHCGIARDRDDKLLGLCSKGFQIHQHTVLGAILDHLVQTKRCTWETVGVLNDGARVFYTVKLKQRIAAMKGDEQELYAVLTTSYDGSGATDGLVTAERPVCNNTLSLALVNNIRAV